MSDIEEFMSAQARNGKDFAFGVDNDGNLYVNGKKVVTQKQISLNRFLNVSIGLGGLGAFVHGVISLV